MKETLIKSSERDPRLRSSRNSDTVQDHLVASEVHNKMLKIGKRGERITKENRGRETAKKKSKNMKSKLFRGKERNRKFEKVLTSSSTLFLCERAFPPHISFLSSLNLATSPSFVVRQAYSIFVASFALRLAPHR